MRLQQGIAFLPIGEIGYCVLGRGGAEHSERPPFTCRIVIESTRLMRRGMRGGRSGHGEVGDGTTFGSQWHPRNADCRGGVFAVFAKIPPPTRFTIRAYMPSPVAASLTVKADADGVWDGVYSDVAYRVALPNHRIAIQLPHRAPKHRFIIRTVPLPLPALLPPKRKDRRDLP